MAPFREYGMGWGLKVMEDVPKGSLVGEYVGEVRAGLCSIFLLHVLIFLSASRLGDDVGKCFWLHLVWLSKLDLLVSVC